MSSQAVYQIPCPSYLAELRRCEAEACRQVRDFIRWRHRLPAWNRQERREFWQMIAADLRAARRELQAYTTLPQAA